MSYDILPSPMYGWFSPDELAEFEKILTFQDDEVFTRWLRSKIKMPIDHGLPIGECEGVADAPLWHDLTLVVLRMGGWANPMAMADHEIDGMVSAPFMRFVTYGGAVRIASAYLDRDYRDPITDVINQMIPRLIEQGVIEPAKPKFFVVREEDEDV